MLLVALLPSGFITASIPWGDNLLYSIGHAWCPSLGKRASGVTQAFKTTAFLDLWLCADPTLMPTI